MIIGWPTVSLARLGQTWPCKFSFDCISLCLEGIDTVRDLYVVYALSAQNAALTGILADAVRIYS